MHKNPVGSLSIIASKNYSIKPFFKAVSNVFKIISFQIENLHRKSKSLFNYNKFLVLQMLINENINIKNREEKAKFMQNITLVLSTPHFLMINWLRSCVTFLILFLKVEIERTFVFPKIMLHTGGKSPKTTLLLAKVL